ncbi:MAG TPA: hypothetical protein V6D29_01350 [Leptolyngbyaceae cyanobacterium]
MQNNDEISPSFKAIDAEVTDEGIVLIHADELEAQRAYFEGQLRGHVLRLEGVRLTWLLPNNKDDQTK